VPASVTATKKTSNPAREKGTTQMMKSARALPTVPGTHGEYPAPHAVATTSAA
jgi:hypothetical protein